MGITNLETIERRRREQGRRPLTEKEIQWIFKHKIYYPPEEFNYEFDTQVSLEEFGLC